MTAMAMTKMAPALGMFSVSTRPVDQHRSPEEACPVDIKRVVNYWLDSFDELIRFWSLHVLT